MKSIVARSFFLVLLGVILLSVSGCKTDDPENSSVRPWNAPQGWESGVPMMNSH
jgi:hypothetical protein